MKFIYPSIITFLISTSLIFANDKKSKNDKEFGLQVGTTTSTMTIDGVINMDEWGESAIITNFIQQIPKEGLPATENTEVRLKMSNINTRFQWRFKPVSDFFVVYTDNYHPESLQIKNRALILKLTYWINV